MAAENSGPDQPAKPKGKPRGRPFPKGVSPNPGGRPKALKEIRERFMDDVPTVLAKLRDMALTGTGATAVMAAKEFLDRVTGKAPQPITGPDEGPVRAEVPGLIATLERIAGSEN